MAQNGLIIVVSAPSGAGKTTICSEVVKTLRNVVISVSVTTRGRRPGDIEGKDYSFVTEDEFKKRIAGNEFIEWALVHNSYYGTPKNYLEETVKNGKDVILEIDVQGGKKIREIYPDGVFIFIMPPSFDILKERLSTRAKDSKETIQLRIQNARKEISCIQDYDYLVVNDELQDAVNQVKAIIQSERRKISRLEISKIGGNSIGRT